MGKKLLASLLPLALLVWRVLVIRENWAVYAPFWSGGVDFLGTPFPYGIIVLFWFLALHLSARWFPLLAPLGAGAAPWLPRMARQGVYLGCALAAGAAFLGEGFLYLVNAIALDSRGHIGEMPLADLALLAWCTLFLCLTIRQNKRAK